MGCPELRQLGHLNPRTGVFNGLEFAAMDEGLHLKFAFAKKNSERNDELLTIFQQMQEQIQELLLE